MRFQVPQFTEVEDKIVGPLTFKQFLYVAGSIGAIVVLFTFLPRFLAIIIALPVGVLGGMLAFYKVNNRPFIHVVEAFVKYTLTSKLYLWKHEEKAKKAAIQKTLNPNLVPKLSDSKLRDLMWSLNVKQSENPVTGDTSEDGNV
jgi:uncharacterized protein YneF (UPF0154 family)